MYDAEPPVGSRPPRTAPGQRFQFLGRVGQGSFGVVWRARDTALGRCVAIKLLRSDLLTNAADRERFGREARAAAQLRHAGIVAVYEMTEVDGLPAIVSEFVEGETLRELVTRQPLTFRESAALIADVADALDYAHTMGVIHRDVKPSNIMVENQAGNRESKVERQNPSRSLFSSRLRPVLLDFGLAMREAVEITMTADDQIIGTPAYMSPEQAAGRSHQVDARSDVYSLGVVLYELLCGEAPFRGSKLSVLHQVLHDEPQPPRRISQRIPRDIETVCQKAMAKQARYRYQTVGEFAADLRRWLAGEAIHARPVGRAERVLRWAKRNPWITLQSIAILVLAVVGVLVAHRFNQHSQAEQITHTILVAEPEELSKLVSGNLPHFRPWADPLLRRVADDEDADPSRRLRASIALVPVDPNKHVYLSQRLLACTWDEFPVIRDSLWPHAHILADRLWGTLRDSDQNDEARFRSGLALSAFAGPDADWSERDLRFLANALLATNPDYHRDLRAYLSPIRELLLAPLESKFCDEAAGDSAREAAAAALGDFARDDSKLLARLTCDATPAQFRLLFPQLTANAAACEAAQEVFLNELRTQPTESSSPSERVRSGRHRAGAAIALVRLHSQAAALDAFHFDDDPESLSQFVHGAAERGIKLRDLIECLDLATTASERFGILLTLGDYTLDSVPTTERDAIVERLVEWHRSDPSSAIHSATGWLLRIWGLRERLAETERTAVPYDRSGIREWFVRRIGDDFVTFVVFRPGVFRMGSPVVEPRRDVDEPQHTVQITRPFALADREVTFAQWRRLADVNDLGDQPEIPLGLTDNHPAVGHWNDAVMLCRWLTGDAGIRETEQSYDTSSDSALSNDPETWPFHLERLGLRVPTEAEWEYACRGGTTTTYSFGSDPKLLPHYAAFDGTTNTTQPVAMLRPSPRGLFDMCGNVAEWCHDLYRNGSGFQPFEIDPIGPLGKGGHIFRGGAWDMQPRYCRSASRASPSREITIRYTGVGFRIACTLP